MDECTDVHILFVVTNLFHLKTTERHHHTITKHASDLAKSFHNVEAFTFNNHRELIFHSVILAYDRE